MTIKPFADLYTALYGVYRCGLDWHCVDIGLSLIEMMTVALPSLSPPPAQGDVQASTANALQRIKRPAMNYPIHQTQKLPGSALSV